MDPMTQSAQISSSDGQNSAAKESKLSDSFLSSSPVSLIQSPQDKRVILGPDKPCEGVATSLRFPSQPGSFSPGKYGSEAAPPDEEPDSPIKTSPVSERIKALEALAAKKKETDFRNEGSFSHFRDRHHEKSPIETPKFPTEITKSSTDKPKLPAEPFKPPVETSKSSSVTTKSPTEKHFPTTQKIESSTDQESPDSPFEVLGDLRQVAEFEETEEWMKAHVPPVPDLDVAGFTKGPVSAAPKEKESKVSEPDAPAAFAGVPDAFMDPPIEAPKLKEEFGDKKKDASLEEEFDLSFLPTAYMWDQQEKAGVQPLDSSSPAPPVGFDSPASLNFSAVATDVKPNLSEEKKTAWGRDMDPPEASEADSSGESDDTVIEDSVTATPASALPLASTAPGSKDPTPASAAIDAPLLENKSPAQKPDCKPMQVPIINVIETDEPNYSDEEMEIELDIEEQVEQEEYDVVDEPASEGPKVSETMNNKTEPNKQRPLETEFMESYSPPSSPMDSDAENSPKHKTFKSSPETIHQESLPESEALPDQDPPQSQSANPQTNSNKMNEELSENSPDNDNEWLEEVCEIVVKPYQTDLASKEPASLSQTKINEKSSTPGPLSKISFMQHDVYDRQSIDYDYEGASHLDEIDAKGLINAKERFLSDPHIQIETLSASPVQNDGPEDITASLKEDKSSPSTIGQTSVGECPQDPNSSLQAQNPSSISALEFNSKMATDTSSDYLVNEKQQDTTSSPEGSTGSEPTDSFVEFMRECLKSRHDEDESEGTEQDPPKTEVSRTCLSSSASPPTVVMNLEQEQLTISALKQLGSSQDEDQEEASHQNEANRSAAPTQQSPCSSPPPPACPLSPRLLDTTYSKEVEAIDQWVAEAYHLAEHVLTAILTHLSVKDLIHWRDPKKSGVVFGVSMLLLLSLAAFSVISVASYLLLALLCVTITFRIYKSVVQAVQKSSEGHPFKTLIDKDVSIPPETFRKHVDSSLTYINRGLKQMSRLFLVEDLVDSLKLAVVMWLLTYVGAVFNGITILILADILLFAVPPVYEKNKTQIDQYIDLVRTQVNTTMAKLQEKLPGAMKRSKTE